MQLAPPPGSMQSDVCRRRKVVFFFGLANADVSLHFGTGLAARRQKWKPSQLQLVGLEMQSDWAQNRHLSQCSSLFCPVPSLTASIHSCSLAGPQQRIQNQPKYLFVSFSMCLFESHTKAVSVGHPCFLLGPGEKVWIFFFFFFLLMEQFGGGFIFP